MGNSWFIIFATPFKITNIHIHSYNLYSSFNINFPIFISSSVKNWIKKKLKIKLKCGQIDKKLTSDHVYKSVFKHIDMIINVSIKICNFIEI